MRKLFQVLPAVALCAALAGINPSAAPAQIRVVGSSTVFPFATAVAERFARETEFDAPIIESTGSGGGLKLFCAGVGVPHPDVTNASRRIKPKELQLCFDNGVTEVVEATIGFDGIAVANARNGTEFSLTRTQLYLALAKDVPVDGQVLPNPHRMWSDVDPSLPEQPIEVLGPPPTSGTRDAFEELALQAGCKKMAASALGIDCKSIEVRNDGAWVDAGENDNLIVSKLVANENAVGVFGYSFLEQNGSQIRGAKIGAARPTFETIEDGSYPLARSLFFYVKAAHIATTPGLHEYAQAYFADAAVGEDGYLADKGLIPLPRDQFRTAAEAVRSLRPLQAADLNH